MAAQSGSGFQPLRGGWKPPPLFGHSPQKYNFLRGQVNSFVVAGFSLRELKPATTMLDTRKTNGIDTTPGPGLSKKLCGIIGAMGKAPVRNQTRGRRPWTPRFIIALDSANCTHCGFCPKICPADVFRVLPDGSVTVADPDNCRGCEVCERTCKARAIRCGCREDIP